MLSFSVLFQDAYLFIGLDFWSYNVFIKLIPFYKIKVYSTEKASEHTPDIQVWQWICSAWFIY